MPNRLRELREARGLSLKELGKAVDRSHQAIAQYETGRQPIPDAILMKAAHVLECSTEDILGSIDPTIQAFALNETAGGPSKDATLRMLEQERRELVAALEWMVARLTPETALEQLHKDVWAAKLSAAAKGSILSAVLQTQERRARDAQRQN
jgi:transcriptional regulator with XRE-family HTH domain